MLISTSRYASISTRLFAKFFAKVLNSKYLPRSKKQIQDLASYSVSIGEKFILLIKEKSQKPSSIEFISVDAFGNWSWLNGNIIISEYQINIGSKMKCSAKIQFHFKTSADCSSALHALKSEEEYKKRAFTDLQAEGNTLHAQIEAEDVVALRATLNSILRYLQVIQNINGGNLNEE